MGSRHPWEITLREFVEKVRRDYGMEINVSPLLGKRLVFEGEGDRLTVLTKLEMDEVLPLNVLRILCRLYGVPPLDFHLDPED